MAKIIETTIGRVSKKPGKFADKKPMPVSIDWDALPEASREFLIAYGVKQYLGDGAAGAESQAEFESGVTERLDAIKDGTCGVRVNGVTRGPSDDPETVAKKLASDAITTRIKTANAKLDKEQKAAAIARYFEINKDALLAEAAAEIASRQKKAKAFDLDAFLSEIAPGEVLPETETDAGAETESE